MPTYLLTRLRLRSMGIARRPACRYFLLPASYTYSGFWPTAAPHHTSCPCPTATVSVRPRGAVLAQYPFAADACRKLFPSTVLDASPPARGNAQALLSFTAATRATCLCPGEVLVARVLIVVCFQLGPAANPCLWSAVAMPLTSFRTPAVAHTARTRRAATTQFRSSISPDHTQYPWVMAGCLTRAFREL